MLAKAKERTRLKVSWYGGEDRQVEVVSATGHWYKAGQGLVLVRWVYVHDLSGTHRDEYFYSTDERMTAKQIIETYTRRWNVETNHPHHPSSERWCIPTVFPYDQCQRAA